MSILSTIGMAVVYKVTLVIHSCIIAVSQLHSLTEKQPNLQTTAFAISNQWNIVSQISLLTLTQLVKIPVASELVRIFIVISVLFCHKLSVIGFNRNKKNNSSVFNEVVKNSNYCNTVVVQCIVDLAQSILSCDFFFQKAHTKISKTSVS